MTTPDRASQRLVLAKRLAEERKRVGKTQAEFGSACGIGKTTQYQYERGERSPDADYLGAAEAIGVDVLYVLTGARQVSVRAVLSGLAADLSPEAIADKVLAVGDKRSAAYRRGLLDVLAFRLDGTHIQCPYQPGSPEFDAYFAGNERGHFQWRLMVEGEWKPN
ncbi:helix-turn-helix transcriptional regulator [Zoogloea sp.]|uniref:helix-turn-helix domain-containing protein n=1 Tax=Zoogloea sp. TaxID=49181 RepID=UPI0014163662|nr:MAG: helix-turn-helix transcriptional regulator [Zoogloea sp.]